MEKRIETPNARRAGAIIVVGLLAGVLLGACAAQPGASPSTAGGGGGAGGQSSPASSQAAAQTLFLQADTVLGGTNLSSTESSCVQQSQFQRNEEIVWRARVVDPATGQPLDDTAMKSVEVKLADQTLSMRYGDHPKTNPTDHFWTVSFEIPADYPTGTMPYTIVATANDGRTGTYSQFQMAPAELTVTTAVHAVTENGD